MYLPYLRGRQNELLCLKELLNNNKIGENVLPIIEPVKYNSTFFSTIKTFIANDRKVIVIANPMVGNFGKEKEEMILKAETSDDTNKAKIMSSIEEYDSLLKDDHIIYAFINNNSVVRNVINGELNVEKCVLINKEKSDYSYYMDYGDRLLARLTLIPKDEDFKDDVSGDTAILEDCYNKARRNVDYIDKPDDFFSKNHLIFKKRGYQGFSDYSMVGNEFEVSGFAPLAIAIHIVYFGDKGDLRIHHFVSDSNENISDPARKFQEAMFKLIKWLNDNPIPMTLGLEKLIKYYNEGKFPGLGVIKKYSIMHHLELINNYLEG